MEAKGVTLAIIQDQIKEAVLNATKLTIEGYQKVWCKLHVAPDAGKCPHVLRLCELLFSLPFTNGHVEIMFSAVKTIKTDRQTNLKSSTLLDIQVEDPPLAHFSADQAVTLRWEECKAIRRVSQEPGKE